MKSGTSSKVTKTGGVKKLGNFQTVKLQKIQLDFTHSRKNGTFFENLQTRETGQKNTGNFGKLETRGLRVKTPSQKVAYYAYYVFGV